MQRHEEERLARPDGGVGATRLRSRSRSPRGNGNHSRLSSAETGGCLLFDAAAVQSDFRQRARTRTLSLSDDVDDHAAAKSRPPGVGSMSTRSPCFSAAPGPGVAASPAPTTGLLQTIENDEHTPSITFVYGPMFAGKTSLLMRIATELEGVGKPVMIVRPSVDTRYGTDAIRSHPPLADPAYAAAKQQLALAAAAERRRRRKGGSLKNVRRFVNGKLVAKGEEGWFSWTGQHVGTEGLLSRFRGAGRNAGDGEGADNGSRAGVDVYASQRSQDEREGENVINYCSQEDDVVSPRGGESANRHVLQRRSQSWQFSQSQQSQDELLSLPCQRFAELKDLLRFFRTEDPNACFPERDITDEEKSGARKRRRIGDRRAGAHGSDEGNDCNVLAAPAPEAAPTTILIDELHLFPDSHSEAGVDCLFKLLSISGPPFRSSPKGAVANIVVFGLDIGFNGVMPCAQLLMKHASVRFLRLSGVCPHCLDEAKTAGAADDANPFVPAMRLPPATSSSGEEEEFGEQPPPLSRPTVIAVPIRALGSALADKVGGAEKYRSVCEKHYAEYLGGTLADIDYEHLTSTDNRAAMAEWRREEASRDEWREAQNEDALVAALVRGERLHRRDATSHV